MARLRVRIELNRGGIGVPLHKLASVVDEARKFFYMLAEDIHVDQSQGDWLGFDFGNESLNFTAEFIGPVTAEQVSAFHGPSMEPRRCAAPPSRSLRELRKPSNRMSSSDSACIYRTKAMNPQIGAACLAGMPCASRKKFKC